VETGADNPASDLLIGYFELAEALQQAFAAGRFVGVHSAIAMMAVRGDAGLRRGWVFSAVRPPIESREAPRLAPRRRQAEWLSIDLTIFQPLRNIRA
jgi:hypothetical protein